MNALRVAYTTTLDDDKGLRGPAAQVLLDHQTVLSQKAEIEATVRGIDGLAYELYKRQSSKKPNVAVPSCDTCRGCRDQALHWVRLRSHQLLVRTVDKLRVYLAVVLQVL